MTARSRYEILVRTCVSRAALARLRIALTPIAVPRGTVYRLRVPADRDITEVVRRLTERDVQLLEVRKCTEPPGRSECAVRASEDAREEPCADVIAPFRTAVDPCPDHGPIGFGPRVQAVRSGAPSALGQGHPAGRGRRSCAADDAPPESEPRGSCASGATSRRHP